MIEKSECFTVTILSDSQDERSPGSEILETQALEQDFRAINLEALSLSFQLNIINVQSEWLSAFISSYTLT